VARNGLAADAGSRGTGRVSVPKRAGGVPAVALAPSSPANGVGSRGTDRGTAWNHRASEGASQDEDEDSFLGVFGLGSGPLLVVAFPRGWLARLAWAKARASAREGMGSERWSVDGNCRLPGK
jgi:hypothetical protein